MKQSSSGDEDKGKRPRSPSSDPSLGRKKKPTVGYEGGGGGGGSVRGVTPWETVDKHHVPLRALPLGEKIFIRYRSKLTPQQRKLVLSKLGWEDKRKITLKEFQTMLGGMDAKTLLQLDRFMVQHFGPYETSSLKQILQHRDAIVPVNLSSFLHAEQMHSLLGTSKHSRRVVSQQTPRLSQLPVCRMLKNPLLYIRKLIHHPQVEKLCLSNNHIDLAEIRELVHVLPHLTKLRILDLSNNPLGGEGIRIFAQALPFLKKLEELNIHNTGTNQDGFRALADVLNRGGGGGGGGGGGRLLPKLRVLHLGYNRLDENTGAVIGEILRNVPTLKKLFLDNMKRDEWVDEDQGFVRLAPSIGVLKNLEELDVEWSDIGDGEDMTALNQSLQSLPKLKVLRLDGNFIEEDCDVLLQNLEHSNLEELYLSANRIFHFQHMVPRLPHKLEFLDLSENFILGRMELQRAFSQNIPNLEVNLEDQQSDED